MPQSKRWALKQELDRAIKQLEQAEDKVVKVGHEYKEKYAEIYQNYCNAVNGIEVIKNLLQTLRDKI